MHVSNVDQVFVIVSISHTNIVITNHLVENLSITVLVGNVDEGSRREKLVPSFPFSLHGVKHYGSQIDLVCNFSTIVNYVFNTSRINCDPHASLADIFNSLAKLGLELGN